MYEKLKDLNRDKEKTSNMIKEFQQKTEEKLEFNEAKEHCEDLESLIKDKSEIINATSTSNWKSIKKSYKNFVINLKRNKIKVSELIDKNSRLEQNSLQNSKTVKELEENYSLSCKAESSTRN
ncbi:unnamed protein product [Rhizophagus irregularis]|nr:unnamed protein product [Rhizophagus irregularis]